MNDLKSIFNGNYYWVQKNTFYMLYFIDNSLVTVSFIYLTPDALPWQQQQKILH